MWWWGDKHSVHNRVSVGGVPNHLLRHPSPAPVALGRKQPLLEPWNWGIPSRPLWVQNSGRKLLLASTFLHIKLGLLAPVTPKGKKCVFVSVSSTEEEGRQKEAQFK